MAVITGTGTGDHGSHACICRRDAPGAREFVVDPFQVLAERASAILGQDPGQTVVRRAHMFALASLRVVSGASPVNGKCSTRWAFCLSSSARMAGFFAARFLQCGGDTVGFTFVFLSAAD